MIKLKAINDGDKKYVVLRDRYYDVVEEHRGKKRKFWLKMDNVKTREVPIRLRQLLCKLGRNEVSCDDWGEVISSKIGKEVGVNIIEYFLAEYEEYDKVHSGVLCGSYFVSEDQYEMSVKDLQSIYTNLVIDENTCETSKPINTVYSILDDLDEIIDFPPERKEFTLKKLKRELLIQCLFDYILAQSDRHWLNTTFLVYEQGGNVNISKADCYDNGNIAFLQRKLQSLQGISKEIGKDPLKSPLLKKKMDAYIPMMGVKTSTVKLVPTSEGVVGSKMMADISAKDAFVDELTDEILNNPDLAYFFIHFRNTFSMDKVAEAIKKEGEEAPAELLKLVNDVITYQVDSLNKVLQAKIQRSHEEDKEMK